MLLGSSGIGVRVSMHGQADAADMFWQPGSLRQESLAYSQSYEVVHRLGQQLSASHQHIRPQVAHANASTMTPMPTTRPRVQPETQ
jgi:hypothetical protein